MLVGMATVALICLPLALLLKIVDIYCGWKRRKEGFK